MDARRRITANCLWVAIVAALCFALAVLVAASSSLGFVPTQHPLGLLGALPGAEGLFYRSLLYWVPAVAALWVTAALWSSAVAASRSGRLALMLLGIAAAGFLAMGIFPLHLEDAAGRGAGAHAASWLLWLSAWLAALAALVVAFLAQGRRGAAAACALLAGLTLMLAAGLDGLFSGPLAQLLCWGGWFAALLGLAAYAQGRCPAR